LLDQFRHDREAGESKLHMLRNLVLTSSFASRSWERREVKQPISVSEQRCLYSGLALENNRQVAGPGRYSVSVNKLTCPLWWKPWPRLLRDRPGCHRTDKAITARHDPFVMPPAFHKTPVPWSRVFLRAGARRAGDDGLPCSRPYFLHRKIPRHGRVSRSPPEDGTMNFTGTPASE